MAVITKRVTIGTSNALVLSEDISRNYVSIVNDSANEVYLGIGTNAMQGQGILLTARGSSFEISKNHNFNTAVINAVGTTNPQGLAIHGW